jgi:hypothetical protein
MSPAEALLHFRSHGVLQQPALQAVSVPLQPPPHDFFQPHFLSSALSPMQHHVADTRQPCFHQSLVLPVTIQQRHGLIDERQELHGQQLLPEQPLIEEQSQDRHRDLFGPPIARFAPTELPRIVLPLRSACGIKPMATLPLNTASPCAPGRASMPAPASPPPLVAERHMHEVVRNLALEFDMRSVAIGAMIGRGAFGEVYKATYRGQEVAVKQIMTNHVPSHMMQDIQHEFQKEVEVMQKLKHPNVVAYIGSSVLGSGVAGAPLARMLRLYTHLCSLYNATIDAIQYGANIETHLAFRQAHVHSHGVDAQGVVMGHHSQRKRAIVVASRAQNLQRRCCWCVQIA